MNNFTLINVNIKANWSVLFMIFFVGNFTKTRKNTVFFNKIINFNIVVWEKWFNAFERFLSLMINLFIQQKAMVNECKQIFHRIDTQNNIKKRYNSDIYDVCSNTKTFNVVYDTYHSFKISLFYFLNRLKSTWHYLNIKLSVLFTHALTFLAETWEFISHEIFSYNLYNLIIKKDLVFIDPQWKTHKNDFITQFSFEIKLKLEFFPPLRWHTIGWNDENSLESKSQ